MECPACHRILYNRRLANCGFCGASIPQELRFSNEEIAALNKKVAAFEAERKAFEEKVAKEEEDARRTGGDYPGPFFF